MINRRVDHPIHSEKPWEDYSLQGIKCKYMVGLGTCPCVPKAITYKHGPTKCIRKILLGIK